MLTLFNFSCNSNANFCISGCAQKGDVLHENEEGLFELNVECDCSDCYSSRSICISSDIAATLATAGYLEEFEETIVSIAEDKLSEVLNFVEEKIEKYTADHEALTSPSLYCAVRAS